MTQFSSSNQPSKRRTAGDKCRNGHSMAEGDPNVRARSDGHRVCRACESDRNRSRREWLARIKAGVTLPFTVDNLFYDEELYKHTHIDILTKFYAWQSQVLAKAKESPNGMYTTPNGVKLRSQDVITILEREQPVLKDHIFKRMGEERPNVESK